MRPYWQGLAAAILAVAVLASPANAFFPIGGYASDGVLYYQKWRLAEFDTNGDGNVTDGEGLEVLLEGGRSGFTASELDEVRDSLEVWSDVPTSYVEFRENGVFTDPIPAGAAEPDFVTTIVMEVTEGDGEDIIPDPGDITVGIAFPILGVTITTWTVEETTVTSGTETVQVSPGTIIDSDIVIAASPHRDSIDGIPALAELKGTVVHELGHLLGIGHSPLNNLEAELSDPADPTSELGRVEKEVFWMTQPNGVPRFVGVTPTMFWLQFDVEDAVGEQRDGGNDLAPDDISAISWLYPRGSQINFFNVADEARTQTRGVAGLPSAPILGAHIVAWADLDNNPGTARVPMFSTMTGLYINAVNDLLQGRFNLMGIWKQFEVPRSTGGALFNPTYTFTMSGLNEAGYEEQAPPSVTAADTNSIEGNAISDGTINDNFLSEVYRETDNVFGILNHDAGTSLVWSFERGALISADSDKTLAVMLKDRPMFGDPNDVCPLNVIYGDTGTGGTGTDGGTGGGTDGGTDGGVVKDNRAVLGTLGIGGGGGGGGLKALRAFRDNFLLKSAAGTAVVDLYYTCSPYLARYLLSHGQAAHWFRRAIAAMFWMMENFKMIGFVLLGAWAAVALFSRRWQRALAHASLALLFVVGATLPAHARIAYVTTPQMAATADAVVTATVFSTKSRIFNDRLVVTDVVLDVAESLKGDMAKQSRVTITIPGGKAGKRLVQVSEMPTFAVGQEVLLYLRQDNTLGYTVHGGIRGSFEIRTDKSTGEKTVHSFEGAGDSALAADLKSMKSSEPDAATAEQSGEQQVAHTPKVSLGAYLSYLSQVIQAQNK